MGGFAGGPPIWAAEAMGRLGHVWDRPWAGQVAGGHRRRERGPGREARDRFGGVVIAQALPLVNTKHPIDFWFARGKVASALRTRCERGEGPLSSACQRGSGP